MKYKIEEKVNKHEILKKVNKMKAEILRPPAQLWCDFDGKPEITLWDAVQKMEYDLINKTEEWPAFSFIHVVMARNRRYYPTICNYIKQLRSNPYRPETIQDLEKLVMSLSSGLEYKKYFGENNIERLQTMQKLMAIFNCLRIKKPNIKDDHLLMKQWAHETPEIPDEMNCFRVPNFSKASIAHLRLHYTIDGIKPDVQVKNVLEMLFNLPSNLPDEDAIKYCEEIAAITNIKPGLIDKLFVNYGSMHWPNSKRRK